MYSFDLTRYICGKNIPIEVVFLSHNDIGDHLEADLEELVEGLNRRISPSRLLFICPVGIEAEIKQCFKKNSTLFHGRLKSTSNILISPYDNQGKLDINLISSIKPLTNDWNITDEFLSEMGEEASSKIFNGSNAILNAPHGYKFRKLSGQEEDIFVHAGNMLLEPTCLAVFDYLLLRKLPIDCRIIYIDSFTILSFALSLQSLIKYFHGINNSIPIFAIVNIHSYKLDPKFRVPNDTNYLFLISASTTGNFRRKLISYKQAAPERVIHLIGVGKSENGFKDTCIYFKSREPEKVSSSARDQKNTIIEIRTEEFLISMGPPRPVSITKAHINDSGSEKLHDEYYRGELQIHEPRPASGPAQGYSTFSISTEGKSTHVPPIREWVKEKLVHELPATLQTLVYAQDTMSKNVATWINNELGGGVTMITIDEIKNGDHSVPNNTSVAVVAFFDPGLETLRRSNIFFRDTEDVHRHYVIGYAFPASKVEFDRHKADICMGRNGPQYGWSEYFVLPVGDNRIHASLALNNSLLDVDEINACRSALGNQLADSLIERANRSKIRSNDLLYPRIDGTPLTLRHDSVFFSDDSVSNVSQIAVYAMVSSAMQSAREPEKTPNLRNAPKSSQFDNNPFVRSVLDPSMFARYSDGILQASLLRSAQCSELDYSGNDDLSHNFASIARSIFIGRDHEIGDAALEFVNVLVTNKIALREVDKIQLIELIESDSILRSFRKILDNRNGLAF